MPWSVKRHDRCPSDKPWGVVKDADNELQGCHPSEDEAKAQQAALYANEGRSLPDDPDPRERPPRDNLVRALPEMELRAIEEGGKDGRLGTLIGRMANYNTWAEVQSVVEGHFMERTLPGAFTKTFSENRSRMQVIFDHGMDRNIGRKPLGPLEDVIESDRAIDYQAALIDTSYNRDLLPGLRAGLYGSSYRMGLIKDAWKVRPGPSDYNPAGLPERSIREVKVIELGPTPFPVYAGTSAGVRSLTDEYLLDKLRDGHALPTGPEASPQSDEGRRAAPVALPSISLDDFVERLTRP